MADLPSHEGATQRFDLGVFVLLPLSPSQLRHDEVEDVLQGALEVRGVLGLRGARATRSDPEDPKNRPKDTD